MKSALANHAWDLIICDYSLPKFSAPQALVVLKESGHDLPFIIVSGTIGEESAVSALKAGAHDFIVKGSMARLIPAIQREMKDASVRHERQQRERELEAVALVSATTRSASTLDEMLPRLLDQILELIGTESGSIWLYDAANDSMNLVIQRTGEENRITSANPGEDLPGLVVKSGEPVISREFRSDLRLPEYIREQVPKSIGGV